MGNKLFSVQGGINFRRTPPILLCPRKLKDEIFDEVSRSVQTEKGGTQKNIGEAYNRMSSFLTVVEAESHEDGRRFWQTFYRRIVPWIPLLTEMVKLWLGPMILVLNPFFFRLLVGVNDGLAPNRLFVYGIQAYYQILIGIGLMEVLPIVLPPKAFPLKKRALLMVIAILVNTLAVALLAEVWGIFPIPFSPAFSGSVGYGMSLCGFYLSRPRGEKLQALFQYAAAFEMLFGMCFFVFGLWGVCMLQTQSNPLIQLFMGLLLPILSWALKNQVLARITTKLSPMKFMILNFSVDIQCTLVAKLVLPFIVNNKTFILLAAAEVFSKLFKIWAGGDRLMFLLKSPSKSQTMKARFLRLQYGPGLQEKIWRVFCAPVEEICKVHNQIHDNRDCNATCWVDRELYLLIDTIGESVISIIGGFAQLIVVGIIRMSAKRHLKNAFQLDSSQWIRANTYGYASLAIMILTLCYIGCCLMPIVDMPDGRTASMRTIIRTILGNAENKRILFGTFCVCEVFIVAACVEHFGWDFTLAFDWLDDDGLKTT